MSTVLKPIRWVGQSLADLKSFPEGVRREVGLALLWVQHGKTPRSAKPMEGFKGARVLKIVEDFDGNTYRAVYTVKFEEAVYVLHCFQKQSKSGAATPSQDLEMVQARFKRAEQEHRRCEEKKKSK